MLLSAMLAFGLLAQQSPWKVEFTGKAGFEHVYRVLALKDRLVFLDSPPMTLADGGDVYLWRDKDPLPSKVLSVQEQGVKVIRQFGKTLVIPGIDAMESWDWGNWYASTDSGQTWTKYRNLPHAVHVFDAAEWHGKFYMGISDTDGAVLESDTGKEWKKAFGVPIPNSFGEVLSLLPLPDALYAFWTEQWGTGNLDANKKTDCYRFDGKKWEPRKLLPIPTAVWNTKVIGSFGVIMLPGRSYLLRHDKATTIPSLDGLVPLDVEELGSDLIWLAAGSHYDYALFRTSFDRSKGEVGKVVKLLDLPPALGGECLAIHNGKAYVGCYAKGGGQLISTSLAKLGPGRLSSERNGRDRRAQR